MAAHARSSRNLPWLLFDQDGCVIEESCARLYVRTHAEQAWDSVREKAKKTPGFS
jgi:hypothetical protein